MRRQDLTYGLGKAVPIVLGYIPIGFAFGVLAHEAGLSIGEILAMSVLVFAGSSQFIAVAMLQAGAGIGSIVATAFIVNLRQLLFSASITPYLKGYSAPKLALLSYELTDESFAVAMGEFANDKQNNQFLWGLFPPCHAAWALSTVLGALVGNLIPDPGAFGLDYALTAMFICLLIFQVKDRVALLTALVAAAAGIGIYLLLPGRWNIIIATILAATVGVGAEKWLKST
ncbi:MAG: AzlC family ABC transporter permease [Peptococcaceae bacterium]|nr:AzlC family ABC transporter permease [Peptococcaceae bacterium]